MTQIKTQYNVKIINQAIDDLYRIQPTKGELEEIKKCILNLIDNPRPSRIRILGKDTFLLSIERFRVVYYDIKDKKEIIIALIYSEQIWLN